MRYLALACDFDGTLASGGVVSVGAVAALQRVRESGRKLILVTGRQLDDLLAIFPHTNGFDRIVAENGGVLYRPGTREERLFGEPPSEEFVRALQKREISPLSVGRVIVSTWQPHETAVLETIRDLGLELGVVFNKGAVMVLPSGVNKATGLQAALGELGLSPHNCVGVGDAENDHAFLRLCECAVAVANALPLVQERADWVTAGRDGAGVIELIERLVASDLKDLAARLSRHAIPLGTQEDGEEVRLPPHGVSVLIAGSSGSGKSTFATAVLERLAEHGYQFCIVDPEGDYASLEGAVVLGDKQRAPAISQALDVLEKPDQNVVINLLGLDLAERPAFFASFVPRVQELRARTGRPHWIVLDEAHHLLPASSGSVSLALPQALCGMILITVHPDHIAPTILSAIDIVVAIGRAPAEPLRALSEAIGTPAPALPQTTLEAGEALYWSRSGAAAPVWLRSDPPRAERRRHVRKYAEGELGEDKSFYFRGPDGKLNLRAQNLGLFAQLAAGVDDDTWAHHLRHGDYSRWFREAIKDEDLALEAAAVEARAGLSARDSRALIRAAIDRRYTLPS